MTSDPLLYQAQNNNSTDDGTVLSEEKKEETFNWPQNGNLVHTCYKNEEEEEEEEDYMTTQFQEHLPRSNPTQYIERSCSCS
jgi:hypothetical protein